MITRLHAVCHMLLHKHCSNGQTTCIIRPLHASAAVGQGETSEHI